MRKIIFSLLFSIFFLNTTFPNEESNYLHHSLNVSFDIKTSKIFVTDTITFSGSGDKIQFFLNPNLKITYANTEVKKLDKTTFGNTRFEVYLKNTNRFILTYEGEISNNKEHFTETGQGKYKGTSGLIFENGIYLSGTSYWVPSFEGNELFTFSLNVNLPEAWKLVSQGHLKETKNGHYTYESLNPGIQVYLIANKWTEYKRTIAGKEIRVFLLNPDEGLAQKYLGVTSKYMMIYEQLIGEYPYSKFDVVENFWETGFGMPSFTLLGQQVIRFPWILSSSYPHEYLHNYWGNSVYIDHTSGNWSEGLTTYMADYLIQEQNGEGANYRRNMLKKYTDYVTEENDYPVRQFKSKTDEASDAIGYGKVFMVNHMLRSKFGTQQFVDSYADFYAANKFKKASFGDIQKSVEKITGDDLSGFFDQWVNGVGAPSLFLKDVTVRKKRKKYQLDIYLTQHSKQNFKFELPIYVYLKNARKVIKEIVSMDQKSQQFTFAYDDEPIRVDIDPEFDVMRKLDKKEVPASLSQILGSKKWLVVLPSESPSFDAYKSLANQWKMMYTRRGKNIEIIADNKLEKIPDEESVWVLGNENLFKEVASVDLIYKDLLDTDLKKKLLETSNNGLLVYTVNHPDYPETIIAFLHSSKAENISKISRKIMHYGNKSYVGFEPKELKNNVQGVFPVIKSPLSKILSKKEMFNWNEFSFPETDLLFQQ